MRHLARWLAVLVGGISISAHAGSERDRIGAERAAAVAQLAERERACRAQFVVTACVEAAQREERVTLARLRRQEQALDDADRRAAAERRRRDVAERLSTQAARASEPAPAVPRDGPRPAPSPNPPAPTGAEGPVVPRSASAVADQRATEQRNAAAFEAKARAAKGHREAVERRNAERAATGKVVAPLPVPSGASAP